MTAAGLFAVALLTAVLSAYTRAFQGATLYWGQELSDGSSGPTGLQGALTPQSQNFRNIAVIVLLVGLVTGGFAYFPWYVAIATIVLTVFASAAIQVFLMPAPNGPFFAGSLLRMLARRRAAFVRNGDELRRDAVDFVLDRLIESTAAFGSPSRSGSLMDLASDVNLTAEQQATLEHGEALLANLEAARAGEAAATREIERLLRRDEELLERYGRLIAAQEHLLIPLSNLPADPERIKEAIRDTTEYHLREDSLTEQMLLFMREGYASLGRFESDEAAERSDPQMLNPAVLTEIARLREEFAAWLLDAVERLRADLSG